MSDKHTLPFMVSGPVSRSSWLAVKVCLWAASAHGSGWLQRGACNISGAASCRCRADLAQWPCDPWPAAGSLFKLNQWRPTGWSYRPNTSDLEALRAAIKEHLKHKGELVSEKAAKSS